ncbi:unnamed protein product [Caenorhabditis brenneri]
MTQFSTEIDQVLDMFTQKNLVFQPDFENSDPKRHYQYSEDGHENYHRSTESSKKELILQQKWRRIDENVSANPIYEKNHSLLRDYLKNYRNRGVDFLETIILEILNNGREEADEIESLPGLRKFFKNSTESEQELMEKFRIVVEFALRAEDLLPERIYRLVDDVMSASFSQEQCACLLAWMWFDTRKNRSFFEILTSTHPISIEKIKFLLNFFSETWIQMPRGVVSFLRIKSENFMENQFEKLKNSKQLSEISIRNDLLIEETALCTQVDFANKHIGGGVLRLGGVQEEIRFLMCPEMMVSMLICDKMEPDEAISIVGAQVYSSYTGYSGKLKWRELQPKDALQNQYRDKFNRIQTECLAINAIKFFGHPSRNLGTQLQEQNIQKELTKAAVGFAAHGPEFDEVPIFSGWWGCGAYSGNKPLKFLIQLMAASIANRPLVMCTFGDSKVGNRCRQMKKRLEMDGITVDGLYDLLLKVPILDGAHDEMHVFDEIERILCERAGGN